MQRWDTFFACLHQTSEASVVKCVYRGICIIGNGINIKCNGIAFITTNDQPLPILAKINQLIRIAQIRDGSCQFGQWFSQYPLVLHRYKRNRDTNHAPYAWRPDTSGGDDYFSADASLRGIDTPHTPVYNLYAAHTC